MMKKINIFRKKKMKNEKSKTSFEKYMINFRFLYHSDLIV